MRLLESRRVREALKYAEGPYENQDMEWLTRALKRHSGSLRSFSDLAIDGSEHSALKLSDFDA